MELAHRTEDQVIEDSIDPGISNPRYVHPSVLQRERDAFENGTAEDRYLAERAEQELVAPHFATECCVCHVALFTAADPARTDVTCESCRKGWR